jgi:FixJ family two-component response regulator
MFWLFVVVAAWRRVDACGRPYPSGSLLLSDQDIGQVDCVIIDQNMPELTGTDVLLEIERRDLVLPSVLTTGCLARR